MRKERSDSGQAQVVGSNEGGMGKEGTEMEGMDRLRLGVGMLGRDQLVPAYTDARVQHVRIKKQP